jgi:hypothetical protein
MIYISFRASSKVCKKLRILEIISRLLLIIELANHEGFLFGSNLKTSKMLFFCDIQNFSKLLEKNSLHELRYEIPMVRAILSLLLLKGNE